MGFRFPLAELLLLALPMLARMSMLTWHKGKGWGFQAGVLKGDFANFKAKLSDKNMQMRFWLTNKKKKSTHKKSSYKKVPTKKYLQKSTYKKVPTKKYFFVGTFS